MFEGEVLKAREIIGKKKIDILQDIFDKSEGEPPLLDMGRYRADNSDYLDEIDWLQNQQLLRFDSGHKNYQFFSYAIPLISGDVRDDLIRVMDLLFYFFREIYKQRLTDPVTYSEIRNEFADVDESVLKLSLYYIYDLTGVCSGGSTGFPYNDEHNDVYISESILRRDSVLDVLLDYSRWHFINPRKELSLPGMLDGLFDFSEDEYESRFFRSATNEGQPEWFNQLDEPVKVIILEVDKALKNESPALASMGVRAIIEHVMISKIGDEGGGGFKKKVKDFAEAGFITKQNSDMLLGVINVGNAAIHRAHTPSMTDVTVCVGVTRHMLEGIYVHEPKVAAIKKNTPTRPKSK